MPLSYIILLIGVTYVAGIVADELPACLPKDFHYDFTECDEMGGRWRVSVPRPGTCVGGAPNAPKRVNDCTTSCEAGTYYNKTNLECLPCPPGSYSLGGGIKFDSWDKLPSGFHLQLESFESSFRIFHPNTMPDTPINCTNYGWKPKGAYLTSNGGMCAATLAYSVKLVKPGAVSYTYQYFDESIIFNFEAQNDQCQTIEEAKKYKWPPVTEEGEWKTMTVALTPGLNVLYWKTIGMSFSDYNERKSKPVRIKNIEISGVAYTSKCTPCAPGAYSSQGSKLCTPCPVNTYSHKGSSICLPCNFTKYSSEGSSVCENRPPCSKTDYYDIHTPCDGANKSQLIYEWVKPKFCREDLPSSVTLPPSGPPLSCPPCNPGMTHTNKSGCSFCPKDHFSDGILSCKKCPASTAPNYGHFYKWWHQDLPGLTSRCISLDGGNGCRESPAWQPARDYIHTILGHGPDTFLALSLNVIGFRGPEHIVNGRLAEIGRISFTFELECTSNCYFLFMMSSTRRSVTDIQRWQGSQEKQFFTFPLTLNDSYAFSWIFQRASVEDAKKNMSFYSSQLGVAKIYDISVTNTVSGGAMDCLPCPQGSEEEGCIPCPPGHYIKDRDSLICLPCPANTYVSVPVPYGIESCKACGPGLKSDNGVNCYSDCNVEFSPTEKYDLSTLQESVEVHGSTLFTSSGTHYFHLFNISLCGNRKGKPLATCANNVTYHVSLEKSIDEDILAMVCRSTVVPSLESPTSSMTIQAVSLGEILLGIAKEPMLEDITVAQEFIDTAKGHSDIYFFYSSTLATDACIKGRTTTITLRCSNKDDDSIITPNNCPDGTCDGCHFHFLWQTKHACRQCNPEDYQVVKGECVHRKQTLHYISPQGCIPSLQEPTGSQPCSAITREVQIIIGLSITMALFLIVLLFYFWKMNRRLEYKYMKLVESSHGKEDELPTAESCAIDEEDDDNYETFSEKGTGILGKFRTIRVSDKDVGGTKYETIHLTKQESQA